MRCASIDIGSNTTALLVAEPSQNGLRLLSKRSVFTHLTGALIDGAIDAAQFEQVTVTVGQLIHEAHDFDVSRIAIVATGVVRGAKNGPALVTHVSQAIGIEVQLLSAPEEAELAFLGATDARGDLATETCVIDAGGWSTELIVMQQNGGKTVTSFPIGSGLLTDRFLLSDPPSDVELASAQKFTDAQFASMEPVSPRVALVVGGGATSAGGLLGGVIDPAGVDRVLQMIRSTTTSQFSERFGLSQQRCRLLPAGLIIMQAASRRLGVPLEVGRGGLREGLIWRELRRQN